LVHRQVYTVLTKPIRRHEFLLGKFLGVLVVDLALLVGLCAVIYGVTVYGPRFMGATEEDRFQLANELYTARRGLVPKEPDVSQEAEQEYQKLLKSHELDQVFEGIPKKLVLARLAQQKKQEKRAAAVGRDIVWEFDNVRLADPGGSLFIRFKYDVSVNPPDLQVYSKWMVGDLRQLQTGAQVTTPIYRGSRKDTIRTAREFEVPGRVVAKDGHLEAAFLNDLANSTVVFFPVENGFEVLYKADTFTANFLRAVALIFIKLVFLAALAVFAGSFLSFPVAVLLCLVVFLTGTVSSFVLESFTYLSTQLTTVYNYTLRLLVEALPQFDVINPTGFLVAGRLIPWSVVAWSGAVVTGLKAAFLLGAGLWIFKSREIAKSSV
jgi:ABC-type transport system involved in multi-copper enzyme maturation permease subunit